VPRLEHPRSPDLVHNPAYSQVVKATGSTTVYVAGQVALDAQGNLIGDGDLAAQTTQVMRNVGAALESAGATFADVVKITTYVVGYEPAHRAVIAAARRPFLPADTPPASTLVGVSALADPGWLVEIEAVAVIG
jgi:enamine deaminase RidA (YjgF/YER057c/UK114 family)